MTATTHHTRYFEVIVADAVVTLRRTAERFELQGLYEACMPTFEILRTVKHLGLVVDVRGVIGRPETSFEAAFAPIRKELVGGHPRVATLVETAVGKLQMSRQSREDHGGASQQVFDDEDAAHAFAAGR